MTETKHLLRRAKRLFFRPEVPEHLARHNARAWVRSVQLLGPRWLLAVPQNRLEIK